MIAVPHTYSEWSNVLSVFKERSNDDEVLEAMKAGTVEWQPGVAERFSKRLIDTVNTRMDRASDKFQKDINRAGCSEGAIVQAILSLRKEMMFLANAINLPALPEAERQHYQNLVLEQANNMQKALEESAKKDRSGKISSIVRNHRVNSF